MRTPIRFRIATHLVVLVSTFSLGAQTKEIKLTTGAGEILKFKIENGGATSAESERIRVDMAGFLLGPSKDSSKRLQLIWIFGFKSKTANPITEVRVEELPATGPAIVRVVDTTPQVKEGSWSGFQAPLEISPEAVAWLYSEKPSIFIFRFTIEFQYGDPEILNQLAIFPKSAKEIYTQAIKAEKDKG